MSYRRGKKKGPNTVRQEIEKERLENQVELVDFEGYKIPKKYQEFLERRNDVELIIKKGFVEDMVDDACIYCNNDLLELLCQELVKSEQDKSFTSCVKQTANVSTVTGVIKSMAMPDAHSGYGFSIGGVTAVRLDRDDAVICPGGVGYDINCGVRLIRTNLKHEDIMKKKERIADELQKKVPSGVGTKSEFQFKKKEFEEVLKNGLDYLKEKGYCWEEDLEFCEEHGHIQNANPEYISPKAIGRGINQLGTLGSGNHYLEVQMVDEIIDKEAAETMGIKEKGQICIMVHTGSRGLGHQVCQDVLNVIQEKGIVNKYDKQLNGLLFKSEEGQKYLSAMNASANFAYANRGFITHQIRKVFEEVFNEDAKDMDMALVYDVSHNIAKVEKHIVDGKEIECLVHRKGATRAFPPHHPEVPEKYKEIGQPAIIGGSMGTCSYVVVGTEVGMQKTFGSTCHGAGRKLSRGEAKRIKTPSDILKDMNEKGIVLRLTEEDLIAEECDDAYKDVRDVVETCQEAGITKIAFKLKPLIVVKG